MKSVPVEFTVGFIINNSGGFFAHLLSLCCCCFRKPGVK